MSVSLLFHVQLNITKLWIQSFLSRFDGKYRLVRASLFIYWASMSLYFDSINQVEYPRESEK